MAYQLALGRPLAAEVRRVALEEVDGAMAALTDTNDHDPEEAVHEARKICKKGRALLRLVRGVLPAKVYRAGNNALRDAARHAGGLRDATALLQTFDKVVADEGPDFDRETVEPVRAALAERRPDFTSNGDAGNDGPAAVVAEFRVALAGARDILAGLALSSDGPDAVTDGFARTYKRGRDAMTAAYDDPSPEAFHEWRKRVKYHTYHLRLLRKVWPPVLKARFDEARQLGRLLGDEHDLAELRARLAEPSFTCDAAATAAATALIDRHRGRLQAEARPLGERLFADKPKRLAARLHTYWAAAEAQAA